eukprot:796729-Pyramimonas_sp.AAC.1
MSARSPSGEGGCPGPPEALGPHQQRLLQLVYGRVNVLYGLLILGKLARLSLRPRVVDPSHHRVVHSIRVLRL